MNKENNEILESYNKRIKEIDNRLKEIFDSEIMILNNESNELLIERQKLIEKIKELTTIEDN